MPLALLAVACLPAWALQVPKVDDEAADTNAARQAYFEMRRINPYDSSFDASAARLSAYQKFRTDLAAEKNNPQLMQLLAAQYHAEVWQPIGPAPIFGGQTPTSATA